MSDVSDDVFVQVSAAVELATTTAAQGQLPFAALVILKGEIIGRGVNTTLRTSDPTEHAEVTAVRDACRNLGRLELSEAWIATSCEPCPMCQIVALQAGI